jgi:hypothetical protein
MLDLLWHLRGTIKLDTVLDDASVLDRLEQMLEQQKKPTIERGQQSIVFEEPLWSNLWSSGRATAIYDHGEFRIERDLEGRKLRYDLRSWHGFLFCSFATSTILIFMALEGDFQDGLKFAALAFGWVYGMNILTALLRVPALIRRTVRFD